MSKMTKRVDRLIDSIRQSILNLTDARGAESSICPSESARDVYDGTSDGWRELMPVVRDVASDLCIEGLIRVTQKGIDVQIDNAHGPIRLSKRS